MKPNSSLADDPTLSWRAIVLYGLNTATYKIGLGRSLEHLARAGRDRGTMPELAEVFFDLYAERLRTDSRPQLSQPNRLTVMERLVALHETGKIDRDEAIARVAADASGNVVPRFHTVGDTAVPVRFYDPRAMVSCLPTRPFSSLPIPTRMRSVLNSVPADRYYKDDPMQCFRDKYDV